MKRIILLAGPTASGKSTTALGWARDCGGEIVNADSMQVYRELRDLTARPSDRDEASCPHHLYGILKGDDPCSAERWRDMALTVIEEIWQRGAVPIVVGGTGLYFRSLTEGLSAVPEIDQNIRRKVREELTATGPQAAHKRLTDLDPLMASRLAPGDSQRICRALEVILSSGKSLAHWQNIPPVGGLDAREDIAVERNIIIPDRPALYARCDRRFREMIEQGKAIEEVAALLALNYPATLPVMKALGVSHISRYLGQEIPLEEAISLSQTATRQFAKRQLTWFRNQCISWNQINMKY